MQLVTSGFRSSEMLRTVDWWLGVEVLGQPIVCSLTTGHMGCSETSTTYY
jgi:hypothetical protein